MKTRLKALLRSTRGAITSMPIGIFLIVLVALLVMEYAAALEKYDYVLDLIRRAVNTAVEYNIRDEYRADRVLLLDADAAEQSLRHYIESDITAHGRYTIRIDSVTPCDSPPAMTVTGTGSFPTLLSGFGSGGVEFSFTVTSTNYDLDA